MEFKAESKGLRINLSIFKSLTWFLLGFLSAMIIFLFGLKIISSMWGAILGMCINLAISAYILNTAKQSKTPNKIFTILKPIAYGIISSMAILVVAYFALYTVILSLFNGVAA
jgi:hypothetical protein